MLDVGANLVYHGITGGGGPTAAGTFTDSISWTPQFRASMTYVAGAHSLKVGFNDTYLKAHDSNLINTTGTAYIFFNGTPIQVAEKTGPTSLDRCRGTSASTYRRGGPTSD